MNDGMPYVIVQVPIVDEDDLLPGRYMFHGGKRGWVEKVSMADKLEWKEAKRAANRLSHYSPNCAAYAVPLPVAWALTRGEPARWDKNLRDKAKPERAERTTKATA